MRTLQSALRAILFLLLVLALNIPSTSFALDIADNSVSGEIIEEPLSLEEDSAVLPSSPDSETAIVLPRIAIHAINPGYNLPAGKNSGELIELANLSDDELDLSNISLVYISKPTASSPDGKATTLYSFPDGSSFVGGTILLRYISSPEASEGNQDLVYDTSIAMEGSLRLTYHDPTTNTEEVLSSVCWLGGEDCLPVFSTTVKSRQYTTILFDLETGEYFHASDYVPFHDSEKPGLYIPPLVEQDDESDIVSASSDSDATNPSPNTATNTSLDTASQIAQVTKSPVCTGLEFSEILSYYSEDKSEQFIEFYNSSSTPIPLNECRLRYKNKDYYLSVTPIMLAPNSYFAFYPSVTLTKNPTTSNLYEILDVSDEIIDSLELPHGQKKSTSFALMGKNSDGSNLWQITYSLSPNQPNVFQEFRTCPVGKVINVATGNCVNVTTLETVIKDCGEGKYRNPATGRCKSYDSSASSEPEPCKEGYERNPETNRCRKIKQNNGTDYPLVPVTDIEDSKSFVALGAIIAVLALGALYVIFQFRRDIYYFLRHLIAKIKK